MSWKPWFALLSLSCALAGCAVLDAGAAAEPAVIYRHRFVGAETVRQLPEPPKALALLSGTNATAFRQVAEERLSRWLAGAAGRDGADIRPLAKAMDRWLTADSAAEIRQAGADWSALFAAKLTDSDAKAFQQEIQSSAAELGLAAGTAMRLTARQEGPWTLAVASKGPAPTPAEIATRLAALTRPLAGTNTTLVELEADLPKLAALFGWTKLPVKLGRLELAISGQGENLRTAGHVTYPAALDWSRAPWNVPTNLVHDPLTTFTAVRALGPLLDEKGLAAELFGKELGGSQAFWWTVIQGPPFQTYYAIAAGQPDAELNRLGTALPDKLNPLLEAAESGRIHWNTNKTAIGLTGLSLVSPFLLATNDTTGSWLAGGLFPIVPNTMPAPAELLAQFAGRNDLVLYDWEITQERVGYWRVLTQVANVLGRRASAADLAVARRQFATTERFLQAVSDQLGNTITEVAIDGPARLSFTRKSHLGFTGFELVHLSRWLSGSASTLRANAPGGPAAIPASGNNP